MFQKALTLSNLSKDEVLHVGDSLSSDVSGAMNMGIKSVWINRNNKEIKGTKKLNYMIHKLDELLKLDVIANMT
ncbi:HAD family hydrolase [Metabacillus malikii]|uniref:FMN phosphatase YigB (HAD superfamily) n=1 Tax=Metabacillus malikii TaxID=1504265 RepID=A0ABT9ZLD1_9BACI|nr:HAD family hydrolase [Metabacillus malikii]MDQ0232596.1 FMN phosphatase YigB (HAD superfamily) [Metabacillus malikii]